MKIFGHPWIESEVFYPIDTVDDISKTPSNSLLEISSLSAQSLMLLQYCKQENLRYAVHIKSITEAIYANSLEATFMVCEKELAVILMPIAQNYLFDTQVIAMAKEEEIEFLAKAGIDGVKLT